MDIDQLLKLLPLALKAALDAGDEILSIYANDDIGIEYKKDESPLTNADKNAHQTIYQTLISTNIPLLSEEGAIIPYEERKKWKLFWLIDPLDGTKEFIKRNGEFTVNIALIENGAPIMGIIYAPVLKKIYFGYKNTAFLCEELNLSAPITEILMQIQEKSISLPLQVNRDNYVVLASRSHLSDETRNFIEKLKQQKGNIEITSIGSSLKLCLIAEGTADVYPRHAPTMEWDIAAGHAIVAASGGKVVHAGNSLSLTYNKENLLNPWFIATKQTKEGKNGTKISL